MKWVYFVFAVCLASGAISHECAAQILPPLDSGRSYFIASKVHTGFIVKNGDRVAPLVNENVRVYQVDFSVVKNTQRSWDYCNCYTKTGASLSYVDFGDPVHLGSAISLVAFTEPYLLRSKKMQITMRGGAGFSYLNKIYNSETNPDNIFYSTHISFLLMMNVNLYYSLTSKLRLSLTGQYNHISNGGIHSPNWGINFPVAGLGMEYKLDAVDLSKRPSKPFTDKSIKFAVNLFSGAHNLSADQLYPEKNFFVGGVNVGFIKPLTLVNGLGIGGEFYHDEASRALQARTNLEFNTFVASLSLQHYIFFGKLIFGQQLAIYVTPLNPNVTNKYYQRYFLEYKVYGPWYAGVSLKSHGDVSDYLSFTISRMFKLGQPH